MSKTRRKPRRLSRVRKTLSALGPGLITGASDDDPSGIGTYSQVGSQLGYGLLWMAVYTLPLMIAVQELCDRISLRTRLGLGVNLRKNYPRGVAFGAVLALLVANAVNLGADLEAVADGVDLLVGNVVPVLWLVIPISIGIFAFQAWGSYSLIFQTFRWMTVALLAYLATVVVVRPDLLVVIGATFVPQIHANSAYLVGLVAVLGTTISPYLFFWQASSEADEQKDDATSTSSRSSKGHRSLSDARRDVIVGMSLSQAVMWAIILTASAELHAHGITGISTAAQAAGALAPVAGPYAFVLFSIGLIGCGLLAIPVLSGSATYAIKEVTGMRGSFRDKPGQHPLFYTIVGIVTGIGVGLNLLRIDPIEALVYAAVINGLVAPPLIVLIYRLGNDRTVMGRLVSSPLSRALTLVTIVVMSAAAVGLVVSLLPIG
jgi:NRAMP (natural resistance-associated macrophage protein)-like metal ion transporter